MKPYYTSVLVPVEPINKEEFSGLIFKTAYSVVNERIDEYLDRQEGFKVISIKIFYLLAWKESMTTYKQQDSKSLPCFLIILKKKNKHV